MNKVIEIKKILLSCCLLTTCGYCSSDAGQNEAAPLAEQQLRYPQSREEAIALGYTIVHNKNEFNRIFNSGVKYAYICNDAPMDRDYERDERGFPMSPDETETLEHVVVEGGPNRNSIPYLAFCKCTKLKGIVLPDSVTSIGVEAFHDCTNLALTELPPALKSIKNEAFRGCTNLALTELPPALESIGSWAFCECTKLALTELPPSLKDIWIHAFRRCTNLALTELPPALESIEWGAFYGCRGIKRMQVPDSVKNIYHGAFTDTGLTTLDLSACNDVSFYDSDWRKIQGYDSDWRKIQGKAIDVLDRCIFYSYRVDPEEQAIQDGCEVRLPRGMGTWKCSRMGRKWNKLED